MNVMNSAYARAVGAAICVIVLLGSLAASIMLGATNFGWHTAWQAIAQYDPTVSDQVIIRTTRVPRALIAAVIGASLAVAGAIMQILTRNPLASPSVLGVNAGATLFVVTAATVFSVSNMQTLMWIAFLGAMTAAVTVYALATIGRDGMTPLKVILAGSAMAALFSSFTQGLLVLNKEGLNSVLFWLTGSIAGRSPDMLITVFPYVLLSWVAAMLLGRDMNVLLMGEDTAKGLGQRIAVIRVLAGIIVIILAGASVSVAGPIGFIGIVIPHISRFFVGIDNRWVLPYCILLGAILLILADLVARFIRIPEEIPVGVMTAIIGVPFFMYIARRRLAK
ncbi:iron ABC transporter permease [Paenibacillus sp. FSL H8-0548]|uniref:FecCD family ABC transporter permease n=1 Tax=Paenibacillus sp. FSL H8-0548 TaxID=1920422 RepID=UPI00269AAE24|nr:iron ABC transporter permease [Paenibacillus sp. FSL H8-0548]